MANLGSARKKASGFARDSQNQWLDAIDGSPWESINEGTRYGTSRTMVAPGWFPELPVDNSIMRLRQRLDNANRHFERKAAEVLGDKDAVRLLATLYDSINIGIDEFDSCQRGIALAKLTAANFCEIGAKYIYISEAGQRFIEALNKE